MVRTSTTLLAAGLAAGIVLAGGLSLGAGAFRADDPSQTETDPNVAETRRDSEAVKRRTLEETSEANGTAGFGSARQLNASGDGVVTQAPEPGEILRPGDVALRVAERPLTLVEGTTPMYRELRRVSSNERDAAGDRLGEMTGDDVHQLQTFLIGAGFDDNGKLSDDGVFGASTEKAVKAWQRSVGLAATGKVDTSQIVFVAGPVRVESAPTIGESFSDLTVTDLDPVITANITSQQRSYFAIGNPVEIEFGDRTISGTVTALERTVGQDGSAAYTAEITPDEVSDTDNLETDASAKVTARRVVAEDALTVPVRALIALAEGGWAVEVDSPDGAVLTSVELGKVVDGFAEITSGLTEGDSVMVVTS